MIKVLVVDDSALMRKLLGGILSEIPHSEIRFARNGIEALALLHADRPDVITLDIHMPQMDGLTCLDRIMIERPCPVVMVSSMTAAGADATMEALRLGAVDFVGKPDGAISLNIQQMAPELISKVRSAATTKLRTSLRLQERVRHRAGIAAAPPARRQAAKGEGLVLVGASTGGPPALEALLCNLPASFPWPILVAQHMPATFTGSLARRLDGLCALTVCEVIQPAALKPGRVYIARGNADMIVTRQAGVLMALAAPSQPSYPWHPSADRLVKSAMEHVSAARLIGILMTGMGSDGAASMALLHARGGKTIAEAEETAVVWGMPGELVKANGADWIVPLPGIAHRLLSLAS